MHVTSQCEVRWLADTTSAVENADLNIKAHFKSKSVSWKRLVMQIASIFPH